MSSSRLQRLLLTALLLSAGIASLHLFLRVASQGRSDDSGQLGPAIIAQETAVYAQPARAFSCSRALLSRWAAIEDENDADQQAELAKEAAVSVSDADLPGALELLSQKPGGLSGELGQLLLQRWTGSNPTAAAAWVEDLSAQPVYSEALLVVATTWADTDLPAALRWTGSLPPGESKTEALARIAYEAARTAPLTALDIGCKLPPSLERDHLLAFAVSQWAANAPAAAIDWVLQVPEPELRQNLTAEVAVASAKQDPLTAAKLVASQLGPGGLQDRAAVAVAARWAEQSPEAAAGWLMLFPDTPARIEAVRNVVGIWGQEDSTAATAWVCALPSNSLRRAGSEALAAASRRIFTGQPYSVSPKNGS